MCTFDRWGKITKIIPEILGNFVHCYLQQQFGTTTAYSVVVPTSVSGIVLVVVVVDSHIQRLSLQLKKLR